MDQHRLGMGGRLTPAIKNLLYANGVLFIITYFMPIGSVILEQFALSSEGVFGDFKIWQIVTYMFLHGNFTHIFFNMFILWMFGTELEYEWGTKDFLKYYFITGIGGGVFNLFLSGAPTVGASAAVYGVMAAYAIKYPDRLVYLYFLFPVKVKYLMGFLVLLSLFMTVGSSASNIAHAAHLGGAVVGFVYLKYWQIHYKLKSFLQNTGSSKSSSSNMKFTKGGGDDDKYEYYRKVIDELLDKINRVGYLNLSDEEKRLLDEGSRYLREHDKENYN